MNSDEPPRFSIPDVKPFDPKKLYGVQGGGPQYINVDNKKGRDNPYLLDEDLIEDKYYQFRGTE